MLILGALAALIVTALGFWRAYDYSTRGEPRDPRFIRRCEIMFYGGIAVTIACVVGALL